MESLFAKKWFYLLWKPGPEENPLRCCTNKLNCSLWNDYSGFFPNRPKNPKQPATTTRQWWVVCCFSILFKESLKWVNSQMNCRFSTSLQKSTAKHLLCPSHLSFVRLKHIRRFQLIRSVTVVPPTSNKVKINVKLALIFKINYSTPCFSVCKEISVISLRISSRLPCQGIC